MQTGVKSSIVAIAMAVSISACNQAPKGDNAKIAEEQQAATSTGETFRIDTTTSRIRFTGHGIGKSHPGIFKLNYGNVSVADQQITGGEFEINVKSLEVEEKGDMFQSKLKPHLLSGDFFDADNFGTAKFQISKVEPYKPDGKDTSLVKGANFNISGNLTLKNVTKNITFPANVELVGNTMKAKADFDIDRRQWQMNYGNDKTLGDKFISEKVNIELDLKAIR
ncbi:YceI family protein [Desertivirga brevis]|uniref:YceI family protein n=1 Tax=Desertivirga brevis TaxID=2810310 RepID=UPI001A974A63|nr:YceI family protein [Pedobacter sp. SYSU D00873]